MFMRKGFIGPIGDDLPSLVTILLALGIFFSSLTFTFNAYNEKIASMNKLKGSIDIARVVTQDGLIIEGGSAEIALQDLKDRATPTARSYGLDLELSYIDDIGDRFPKTGDCGTDWFTFRYLMATVPGEDVRFVELKTLEICVGS